MSILFGCLRILHAQTGEITASISSGDPKPYDDITLTLNVDGDTEVYYFGVEVIFDEEVVEFTSIEPGELIQDGLELAGLITKDRVGASVTRTSGAGSNSSGSLMKLSFRIHGNAPADASVFSFSSIELSDSNGEQLEASEPPDVNFQVQPAISDLILDLSAGNEINLGEVLDVTGKIYVNGWTDVESEASPDIRVWIGLNSLDTNPAEWDESAWTEMDFETKESGGFHTYEEPVGYQESAGVYYIALRARFEEADFKYGGQDGNGGGGFWDNEEINSAELSILDTQTPFVYTIAEWNFDDETYLPWSGLPVNRGNEFGIFGAQLNEFSAGSPDRSANSNGWNNDEDGSPYWVTSFSTENLDNLTISSKQYGSGTGPRNFKLQGRTGNGSWENIPDGDITVGNNWTTGVVDQLELPSAYNDREEVSVRWRLVGNTNVNGDENISGAGTNRMDEVMIKGENMNPVDVMVWPGDTDNDEHVDEQDVLGIGTNWRMEGPAPVFNTTAWEEREVEGWVPSEATYADTDGDGVVNHSDLKIIGLNFGESRNTGKQQDFFTPVAELVMDPPENFNRLYLHIVTEQPIQVTGLSYRLRVRDQPADKINIEGIRPGKWAQEWQEADSLILFDRLDIESGLLTGAFVHMGFAPEKSAGLLLTFEILPMESWVEPLNWVLDRLSYTDHNGRLHSLDSARFLLSDTGGMDEYRSPPEETHLDQNYPNPFNPGTAIGYRLSVQSDVRLDVYNIAGRRILTLIDQKKEAGYHEINFDASGLASGIYIYRLRANGRIFSKRMLVIK